MATLTAVPILSELLTVHSSDGTGPFPCTVSRSSSISDIACGVRGAFRTSLRSGSLPEIYGTLALGHCAHIEAGRIVERLSRIKARRPEAGNQDELDFARKRIAMRAFLLRDWVADNPGLLREDVDLKDKRM